MMPFIIGVAAALAAFALDLEITTWRWWLFCSPFWVIGMVLGVKL